MIIRTRVRPYHPPLSETLGAFRKDNTALSNLGETITRHFLIYRPVDNASFICLSLCFFSLLVSLSTCLSVGLFVSLFPALLLSLSFCDYLLASRLSASFLVHLLLNYLLVYLPNLPVYQIVCLFAGLSDRLLNTLDPCANFLQAAL